MGSHSADTTGTKDDRNLGMAAGVLKVVRVLPALTSEQLDTLRELNRELLSRVTAAPVSAADDAFRLAVMAREARPADESWAQAMVRRAVRELGLTFRVTIGSVPGLDVSPDLVFPDARVAVYVNECLWHNCPRHVAPFGANGRAWAARIAATVARDAANTHALEAAGWIVITVWEHDDPRRSADQISAALTKTAINQPSVALSV